MSKATVTVIGCLMCIICIALAMLNFAAGFDDGTLKLSSVVGFGGVLFCAGVNAGLVLYHNFFAD